MKKITSGAVAVALAVAGMLAVAAPASATQEEPPVCVPSDAIPAWTEDVPDIEHPAVYETVVVTPATEGTPAVWANFSPNDQEATFIGPPAYPVDERGTWHDHGTLPPGQAGPDGVYANGNPDKGGNWFYRQAAVEGTPEVTEERLVSDAYTEVTPDIEHPAVPAVTCEEEEPPTEVDPIDCTPTGIWYTEGDDTAPVAGPDGLEFYSAGDGKAVGYRQAISGNIQGLDTITFSATGDLSQFFFRFTVNLSADGGPAYKSLSIPGTTAISLGSNVYQFPGDTLADVAEAYPNNVLTSLGWQTNTGAPAGVGATLHSFDGACGSGDWTWEPLPEDWSEIVEQGEPVLTCDNVAGDEVPFDLTVAYYTYSYSETGEVIETVTPVEETGVYIVGEDDVEFFLGDECDPEPTPEPEPEAPVKEEPKSEEPTGSLAATGSDMTPVWTGGAAMALLLAGLGTLAVARRRR